MDPSSTPQNQWEYLEVRVDDSQDTFEAKWEYLKLSADGKRTLSARRLLRRGPVQFNLGRDIANNNYELLESTEESSGVYKFLLRRPAGLPPPPWEGMPEDEW